MNVIWKAACAAALIAATLIELGCGDVYRPISTPLPVTTGNPSGPETEVVLNLCPTGERLPRQYGRSQRQRAHRYRRERRHQLGQQAAV